MNKDIEKRLEKLEEQTAAGEDPECVKRLLPKPRAEMTNEDWHSEAFIDQFFPDEVK